MRRVVLYTDGACSGNPGPGGWGAVLLYGGHRRELSGGARDTTNNRMELQAVIEGIGALKRQVPVTVYTDSVYVMKGMTEWIGNWKARGWRTASKQPVKNEDLWRQLDAALHDHEWSGNGSRAIPATRKMNAPMNWPASAIPRS